MTKKNHKTEVARVPVTKLQMILFSLSCGTVLVWSYWPTLLEMSKRWEIDPQYSHGYLVPLFAIVLLLLRLKLLDLKDLQSGWFCFLSLRRFGSRLKELDLSEFRPSLWGVPLFLSGIALRHIGTYYYYLWFDPLALIPTLLGLSLLFGGRRLLQLSWPSICFLFFMIPLPFTLESGLRGPLQRVGTLTSTFFMQTIGLPAISEGNVVMVNEYRIGVVEACSGLRMLMIFFALSTAVAFLIDRPVWERVVVVLSSVPIALISNIARITVTGILHIMVNSELADFVFHDLAGWMMMPFALFLLWLELKFLSHLWIVEYEKPLAFGIESKANIAATDSSHT